MDANEIEYYVKKGRQLRSEFIAEQSARGYRAIKKMFRCIFIECGPKKVMKRFRLPSNRLVWE